MIPLIHFEEGTIPCVEEESIGIDVICGNKQVHGPIPIKICSHDIYPSALSICELRDTCLTVCTLKRESRITVVDVQHASRIIVHNEQIHVPIRVNVDGNGCP